MDGVAEYARTQHDERVLLAYRLMRHARRQRSMAIGAMFAETARFVISRVGSVFRPRVAEPGGAFAQRLSCRPECRADSRDGVRSWL